MAHDRLKTNLPKWDWILLPAICLLTILFMAVSAELVARELLPVSQNSLENCFETDDLTGDSPARPNSSCSERIAESRYSAEYKFNSQGNREDTDLKPKQPGTYRIVMIGSSFAMGLFVPRKMTFASLLPEELSRRTGRKIELYNEASGGKFRGGPFPERSSVLRFNQVLSAQPDMILWIITPMDIENSESAGSDSVPPKLQQQVSLRSEGSNNSENPIGKLLNALMQGTLWTKLQNRWEQSRTLLMIQHFMIASQSQSQYIDSYLKNGENAEFLKTAPNSRWLHLLGTFATQAAELENQANAAHIPFVAVMVPNRAQAAMLSMNKWPQGYDAYQLDKDLRATIVSHHGIYVDILPDFPDIPDSERNYFPVDGHLDTCGHAMISRILAKEISSEAASALRSVAQSQGTIEHSR